MPLPDPRPDPAPALLLAAPLRLEAWVAGAELRTGMGPRRASRFGSGELAARCQAGHRVILLGLAGGLDPARAPTGSVLVATAVQREHGHRVDLDGELAGELAGALGAWSLPVRDGLLLSVDRPVRGERRSRLRHTGAVAVDMEAGAIAEALGARGALGGLGVVRVVADDGQRGFVRGGWQGLKVLRRVAGALRVHGAPPGVERARPFGAHPSGKTP